eukprot:GHVS01007385.1.p1 GENE.GHVS01007385.1~~GHVS01007385.1.p1  ORF type:complete len:701 (-),score=159.59 GHVS01007385.1:857-2740(-)
MPAAATSPGASASGGGGGPHGGGGPGGGFGSPPPLPTVPPKHPDMPSEQVLRAQAKKRAQVPPFSPPKLRPSFHYLETFESTKTTEQQEGKQPLAVGSWMKSAHPKFTGPWEIARRVSEGIEGDLGLRVASSAAFHGIAGRMSKKFNPLEEEANKRQASSIQEESKSEVVIQYEAKFENDLQCGGAYMKLFDLNGLPLEQFNAETDYVLMFGPDRCGDTDKVHCIIKVKNPITGKTTEHQLQSPPRVPQDNVTHLYTLRLSSDDSIQIWIDNKLVKSARLSTDMVPPMLPVNEIDDPHDTKPDDWNVPAEIPDLTAAKPDDWDDTQPQTIPDGDATLPEGWLVDEPLTIPDPTATQPADWDEEASGAWVHPVVPNPACVNVGCGAWTAPEVANPMYPGQWQPPMIPNPDYSGEWKPRKIANPEYFEQPLFALGPVDSVGFELWTMQSGLMFDNILVGSNFEDAQQFAKETWEIRNSMESKINRIMTEMASEAMAAAEAKQLGDGAKHSWYQRTMLQTKQIVEQHGAAVLGTSISALIVILGLIIRRSQKTAAKTMKGPAEEEEGEEEEDGEEEEEDNKNKPKEAKKASDESKSRRTTRSRAREEEKEGDEAEENNNNGVRKRNPHKS